MIPYFEILRALTPEAMLVVAAFVALTLDLAGLRGAERSARNRTIGTVALLGLLASTVPLCMQFGAERVPFPGRTLVVNDLTALFNLVIVVLTILTVLISMDFDLGRHVGEYFATLLFGAVASGREDWLDLWRKLPSDPADEEVPRNFPIRFPTLWHP